MCLVCIAFVIDTTGSMSHEITVAKNIVNDFVRAEEYLNVNLSMRLPYT